MPLSHPLPLDHPTERLVGNAPAIRALRAQIRHLATFDTVGNPWVPTLLLHGETGTGKGLVARMVHDSGPRAAGPFIEVNCAAMPETLLEAEVFGFEAGTFTDAKRAKPGLFEAAGAGTLFLDEIEALPLALQAKLLKAIEEKRVRRLGAVADQRVDVKLIAASQVELSGHVAAGRFRADLYHRLAVVILEVPPLRARGDDIRVLAQHFLHRYTQAHRLPPKQLNRAAEAWLLAQDWPGNVRELGHLMERVTLLRPETVLEARVLQQLCVPQTALQTALLPPQEEGTAVGEAERIRQALHQTDGNVLRAARLLGVSRKALRYRMQRYALARPREPGMPGSVPLLPHSEPLGEALTGDEGPQRLAKAPHPSPLPGGRAKTPSADTVAEEGKEAPSHNQLGNVRALASRWEQKPVAVLAIDLTLPTQAEQQAPGYDLWTMATAWEQAITEKVWGFGGVLLPPSPFGLVAAFGMPQSLDQMPQRAVQAALAIRQLVADATLRERTAPCPEMRQAVHLGTLWVDVQASNPGERLLAIGETLALPMRLLGHAAPGDILVSAQVGRLLTAWFELQARQMALGGQPPSPVGAYSVVGLRRPRSALVRHAEPPLSQFMGRERELAGLHDLLEQVQWGQGQVVGIVGEAGVGKSRLVYEFRQRLTGQQVTALEGHCLAYGSSIPYLPVRDVVRHACEIHDADAPEAMAAQVCRGLQEVGMDPAAGTPYLLQLLGVKEGTDRLAELSPEAVKARTFATLRQMLLHGSQRQPLLVIVEDLQWVDQTSDEFLASLVESLAGTPLLLCLTYRPGYRPSWIAKSYATQLTLPPLSPPESLGLVHSVLPREQLPEPLAQMILTKADGNPFFLEELTRAVAEREELPPTLAVPDTIQGVLMARTDRLAEHARRVLQTASVLGREFSFRLLEAIWAGPGILEPALRELQRLEFLYEQIGPAEPSYLFKHALTQEVIYTSLARSHRQALHAAAGRALEVFYAERLEEVYDRLAHHYAQSDEAAKAVEYLTRFATRAAQGYAHTEAVTALQEALLHAERLPAEMRDRRRLELALQLAHSLRRLGRLQEAIDLLLRHQEQLEQLQEPALAGPYYFRLGHTYNFLGDRERAAQSLQQAVTEATRCGDEVTMGKACYVLALEGFWSDPLMGIEHSRQAVALLEHTKERYWLGLAHWILALNCLALGEFDRALEAVVPVQAIGEAIGDPRLQSWVAWLHGWIYATRGDWDAGITACQHGVECAPIPYDSALALGLLGYAHLEKGDVMQAVPVLEQAVQFQSQVGYRQIHGWFTTLLAEAYFLQGHLETARELAVQGLAITRETKFWHGVGWTQRVLGHIAKASGVLAQAETHLTEALETFATIQARFEMGRTHLALAELAHTEGNREVTTMHLHEAHALFRALRVPKYVERTAGLAQQLQVALCEGATR